MKLPYQSPQTLPGLDLISRLRQSRERPVSAAACPFSLALVGGLALPGFCTLSIWNQVPRALCPAASFLPRFQLRWRPCGRPSLAARSGRGIHASPALLSSQPGALSTIGPCVCPCILSLSPAELRPRDGGAAGGLRGHQAWVGPSPIPAQ